MGDDLVKDLITTIIPLPYDQAILILTLLLSFPLVVFQRQLPGGTTRHLFSVAVGVAWCTSAFGAHGTGHVLLVSAVTFILVRTLPTRTAAIAACVWLFVYLSGAHLNSYVNNYMAWDMDYTGALMILTVKLSWLVLNMYDGAQSPERKAAMRPENEADSIAPSEAPSALEWLSYTFFYPTVLVGPAFSFKGYRDWAADEKPVPNGRWQAAGYKLLGSVGVIVLASAISWLCPKSRAVANVSGDEPDAATLYDFVLPVRLLFVWLAIVAHRLKYNFIWYLSDVSCIAGGFGCNGKAVPVAGDRVRVQGSEGRVVELCGPAEAVVEFEGGVRRKEDFAQITVRHRGAYAAMFDESVDDEGLLWNRCSNGNVFRVEFARNCKDISDNWNMGVSKWLYFCIYVRVAELCRKGSKAPVFLTQLVSAFWHGFYPGYYLFFFSCTMVVETSRIARRKMRPWAIAKGKGVKKLYDHLGWFATVVSVNCLGAPFVFLSVQNTLHVWTSMWFLPHIICIVYALALTYVVPRYREPTKSE